MVHRTSPSGQNFGRRRQQDFKQVHGGNPHVQNLKPSDVNQKVIAAAESGDPLDLLRVIEEHLWRMNLVNMSTSIHRLAKCADRDPEYYLAVTQSPVFEELVRIMSCRLMNSHGQPCLHQTLSNVTWSLAHLYTPDMKLLKLVASMSTQYIDGFKPFELSMLLWGFAKMSVVDEMPQDIEALFQAASFRIVGGLGHFSFRSLAMIAWAFATARQRDPRLFTGVAGEMRRAAASANCQEVGNTVWAFASAGHRDRKLLTSMAQVAMPLLPEFKAQEISNMLWGFATLGFFHEQVFMNSIDAALRMELGAQHLAIILWACSKVMPKHAAMDDLIISFAPLCVVRLGAFKPQEVSSTVQALAKVLVPEKPAQAPETVWGKLCTINAPLHEDVLMLLDSLAQWVALNSHVMTSAAFVTAVCSLVSLGERAERRLDLVLEQAVVARAEVLTPSERVQVLEAFLSYRSAARGAPAVLAAGLANTLDSLHHKDLQTLTQLFLAARRLPLDGPAFSLAELSAWCLAVAAGLPFSEPDGGLCEPEAAADAVSGSETSSEVEELDPITDAPLGSEYHVETAESLPFLYWRPKEEA